MAGRPIKESIYDFDAMDVEDFSRLVSDEAAARARAALLRRRPELSRRGRNPAAPAEEEAQVVLDRLAFTREVGDRLQSDAAQLVYEARRHGASWARIGIALHESPQTAFNRYRHLDQPPPAKRQGRPQSRGA